MGLLKSTKSIPGIDYHEYRDKLYYNKYLYRASFRIAGAHIVARAKFTKDLESYLKYHDFWLHRSSRKEDIKKNIPILQKYKDWFDAQKDNKEMSVRIESDNISVFSNDLALLKTVGAVEPTVTVRFTEAVTAQFAGVKTFVREPKHKFRVYLKSMRVEAKLMQDLSDLFKRNKGLYPSKSLVDWTINRRNHGAYGFRYLSSAYSIDYDDESQLSYLALMHGDVLGRRYKLEKRPETIQ